MSRQDAVVLDTRKVRRGGPCMPMLGPATRRQQRDGRGAIQRGSRGSTRDRVARAENGKAELSGKLHIRQGRRVQWQRHSNCAVGAGGAGQGRAVPNQACSLQPTCSEHGGTTALWQEPGRCCHSSFIFMPLHTIPSDPLQSGNSVLRSGRGWVGHAGYLGSDLTTPPPPPQPPPPTLRRSKMLRRSGTNLAQSWR